MKKLLFVIFLGLVIYANRNHWHINEVFNPGEDYYLNYQTTTTSYGEHLPKWGKIADAPSKSKLEFISGEGRITFLEDKSNKVVVQVETEVGSRLKLNQFYFPGWELKVDGALKGFNYLEEGENYGLPVFDIPPGLHQIRAEFKNTPIRNASDTISIFSVIILFIILCKLSAGILYQVKKSS